MKNTNKLQRTNNGEQPTRKRKKKFIILALLTLSLASLFALLYYNYERDDKTAIEEIKKEIPENTKEYVKLTDEDGKEVLGISETFSSSGTWQAPTGVTEVFVELWGAGGGTPQCRNTVSGGGGGGAYSNKTLTVTPLSNYSYVVGVGGTGTGGDTYWVNTSTALAKGGSVGRTGGGAGSGGAAASGVGDVKYSGGTGGTGVVGSYGGGGGGGAGSTALGKNGSGVTAGGATTEYGGAGGNGRSGSVGKGIIGETYGGGAGGSRATSTRYGPVSGANGFIRITYEPPAGIYPTLAKTSDGWSGAIPISASLVGISNVNYPYARAKIVTPAAETYYFDMTWNSTLSQFEGVIYPGSYYCKGCADPNTGTFTVTAELDNSADFSSIDYTGSAGTFSTYITRRKSSYDLQVDYASFLPTWNTGGWWDYTINKFSVHMQTGTGTNTVIAMPFHPITSTITDLAVSYGVTPISQGLPTSTGNVWWWDTANHTLYLQFASITTTVQAVNLTFKSDTDLFGTRFDRVQTKDMGDRLFYNGLGLANRYFTTWIYGGGHEGAGEQAESRAKYAGASTEVTSDCMERVAVHVDDNTNPDTSGHYNYNIKWKQQEWANYISSESNNSIVIVNNSDDTPTTGYKQQLDTGLAVKRTQTYYSNERYIENVYELKNNGLVTRKYPVVWLREQWLGTDRNINDTGRFGGETTDTIVDRRLLFSDLSEYWHVSYDNAQYVSMGVIADPDYLDNWYAWFVDDAVITTNTVQWPLVINPLVYEAENIGFDKTFPAVAPSETVSFRFWQWHYATTSWADILSSIQDDVASLQPSIPAPTLPTLSPGTSSDTLQIAFNHAEINSTTPTFRASATQVDGFDAFEIELNTASDFTGTSYSQVVYGTYASATNYNVSVTIPNTDGVTYYARLRASADTGSTWSDWSTVTQPLWAYTYKSAVEEANWVQTTQEQFETSNFVNSETTTSDTVILSYGASAKTWYNSSWLYRKKISIDASMVSGTSLTNFPVYVNLADLGTDFFTNILTTGADIRITTDDFQTEVPREVVFVDTVNEEGELYFKAPTLSGSVNTDFYIYYGNTAATEPLANATYGKNNVWTNNYVAVWHNGEDSLTNTNDSTVNAYNGTFVGSLPNTVAGKIGDAQSFDGSGDSITIGAVDPSTSDLSISAWLNWGGANSNNQTIISKRDATGLTDTRWELVRASTGEFYFRSSMDTGYYAQFTSFPTASAWSHLVMSKVGTTASLYLNGTLVNSDTMSFGSKTGAVLRIGSIETALDSFNGIIDEVRVSNAQRDANWIETEYNNQNQPSSFYNVYFQETSTSEEGSITSTGVDLDWVPTSLRAGAWDEVVVNGTTTTGNGIYVQILNSSLLPIMGKSCSIMDGASTCSISLSDLPSATSNELLYIKATLTATGSTSPSLNDWALKWNISGIVLSITVSDGQVNYGAIPLGTSVSTLASQINDIQSATNNNNVTAEFYIKGSDSTNWTLGSTAGNEFFVHEFCNDTDNDCSTPPTNYTPLTTSYQLLKSGVPAYGSVDFQLRITTPTETLFETQQQSDVTVMITQM